MFRTGTSFEQEEYGRAQAPFTSFFGDAEFGNAQHLKNPKVKQGRVWQAGIGPEVLLETECMGLVRACDLKVGQHVLTLENGFRPILWLGQEKGVSFQPSNPKSICVNPGILGKATHSKHVFFAPGQNLLLRSPWNELFFGASDVLARAEDLTQTNGVERIDEIQPVEWVHILFDRVEMLQADGLWVESMVPEMQSLQIGAANFRTEIKKAAPSLAYEYGFAAYIHNLPVLNKKEIKLLSLNGL